MRFPRKFPGLCHLNDHFYAFCGCFNGAKSGISERFSLKYGNWKRLPEAKNPRKAFNPVIYKEKIYLSAGGSCEIESFSPVFQQFEVILANFSYFSYANSVVIDDFLCIFNEFRSVMYDFNTEKVTKSDGNLLNYHISSPIVYGNSVVFVEKVGRRWRVGRVNVREMRCEVVDRKDVSE